MSFVRNINDQTPERKKMFGGSGEAVMCKILNGVEEMYGKGRIFNHIRLEKDCEVAWHIHNGDGETYYILKGEGEYSDNGTPVTLRAGDIAFVGDGEGHSLINKKDEPLEAIALILYSK